MKTLPVGLQIYTIRDYAEKDFAAAMKAVKAMGYDFAELAGLYGHTPAEIKAALDDAGLAAISAHVPLAELIEDTEKTIDDYIYIGVKYIAVPYLGEGQRPGDEGFDKLLAEIERIGKTAAAKGVTLLYHNHDFEFIKMPNGEFGLDYMYSTVGADALQTELDIESLGDLTEEEFDNNQMLIKDDIQRKRAKHAVYENQRTIKAYNALKENDIDTFGKFMVDSHISLRDDYEVSCEELDVIVEEGLKCEGVIGIRMTGGGFGGSCVSIVETDKEEAVKKAIGDNYKKRTGREASFCSVLAGKGPYEL